MIDKDVRHDVFTERSLKAWTWLKDHSSAIGWVVVLLLFAGMLLTVLRNAREARRRLAWDRLDQLGAAKPNEQPKEIVPGATDAEMEEWLRQFRGTDAEPWALIDHAARAFANGRTDRAEALYRQVAERFSGAPAGAWARIGVGACREAAGKPEEARREYEAVRDGRRDAAAVERAEDALKRLGAPKGAGGRPS